MLRVRCVEIGRELPMCISHKRFYARNPQYSATFYRIAAPGLGQGWRPGAWARTTKKDDGLDLGSRGGPRELERQGEGLIATPPKTGADRRRGVLLLISPRLAGRSQFRELPSGCLLIATSGHSSA